MPSPFPGMDPYLESDLWTTIHSALTVEIARQISPLLRPKYIALTEERVIIESPTGNGVRDFTIYPDVGIVQTRRGGTATLTTDRVKAPLRVATVMPEPVPHKTLEIRDVRDRKLITVIELLSPTNKQGKPYSRYLKRRLRILKSSVHLMEIDLLRSGRRLPMRRALPSVPYFVFLSRAGERPLSDAWPITLDQPLPDVPVPLQTGDPDIPLDLQKALTNVYDQLNYDLVIDYSEPPEPPFDEYDAVWAEKLLAKHRRTAGKKPKNGKAIR